LVTGGAGFIGSHLVDKLLEEGLEVGVIDNFRTGDRRNISSHMPKIRLHEVDISDYSRVREVVKDYEAIVHQAALVSVTRSVEDPQTVNQVNVSGTLNLLKAAVDSKIRRFLYASSSSVYGETETIPKVETLEPRPISPYAVSKMAAERYCRVFASVYGLNTVSLRYFNVYGPRQKYGPYSGVIPTFIEMAARNEPPIIRGDGEQTRDFTYVEDVVRMNMLCLARKDLKGEVFNVAGGQTTSINRLAETILRVMGKSDLGVVHAAPRPGDVRHSYADIGKASTVLGYKPTFTLHEGLKRVIDWFAPGGTQRS
jgi:UDP-glucose 4-epimerase